VRQSIGSLLKILVGHTLLIQHCSVKLSGHLTPKLTPRGSKSNNHSVPVVATWCSLNPTFLFQTLEKFSNSRVFRSLWPVPQLSTFDRTRETYSVDHRELILAQLVPLKHSLVDLFQEASGETVKIRRRVNPT
jgi:hypothetical protein